MNILSSLGFGSTAGRSAAAGDESGGAVRADGVAHGFSRVKGKRSTMEDYLAADFSTHADSGDVGTFGVFDGHGGANAAEYVKTHLFGNLLSHLKFSSDLPAAVGEAFVQTDQEYLSHSNSTNREDGCTAVAAILIGSQLLVANVGDSRAVLCRAGRAVPLSNDHKPNRADERQRIENAGGVVVWAGTWRVGGVLAVSRAFGDRPLKRYVVAVPDIRLETVGPEDEFLILASDGVWDVMSNQDAVQCIRTVTSAEAAAKKLTDEAYVRGSNDNISCVVVRFGKPGAGATS